MRSRRDFFRVRFGASGRLGRLAAALDLAGLPCFRGSRRNETGTREHGDRVHLSGAGQPGRRHGQGPRRGVSGSPQSVRRGRRRARRKAVEADLGRPGGDADADRQRAAGADGGVDGGDPGAGSAGLCAEGQGRLRRRPFARRIFGARGGRHVFGRRCGKAAAHPRQRHAGGRTRRRRRDGGDPRAGRAGGRGRLRGGRVRLGLPDRQRQWRRTVGDLRRKGRRRARRKALHRQRAPSAR